MTEKATTLLLTHMTTQLHEHHQRQSIILHDTKKSRRFHRRHNLRTKLDSSSSISSSVQKQQYRTQSQKASTFEHPTTEN